MPSGRHIILLAEGRLVNLGLVDYASILIFQRLSDFQLCHWPSIIRHVLFLHEPGFGPDCSLDHS